MPLGEVEEERLPLDATGPSVSRAVCILFDLNYLTNGCERWTSWMTERTNRGLVPAENTRFGDHYVKAIG